MKIFVGSKNPVKINAVVIAASETWPNAQVAGLDVPSGIPEQPFSDEETMRGASNRARAALEDGLAQMKNSSGSEVLGVGLEGGVTEIGDELWSTVFAAVTDSDGNEFVANGARFLIPEVVASKMRQGEEMGPLISQLSGEKDVRKKQGYIGIVTSNFVDRTEEYSAIAKMALGLWYGRDWQNKLASS